MKFEVKENQVTRIVHGVINGVTLLTLLSPELSFAQTAGTGGAFDGITAFLKSVANLLVFEWGYYIGILTLAIQGYRWKTGRIDLMSLGGWGLGISLVFFAPNIVNNLKSLSSGTIS